MVVRRKCNVLLVTEQPRHPSTQRRPCNVGNYEPHFSVVLVGSQRTRSWVCALSVLDMQSDMQRIFNCSLFHFLANQHFPRSWSPPKNHVHTFVNREKPTAGRGGLEIEFHDASIPSGGGRGGQRQIKNLCI